MAGCFETYSSANVRTSFLNDERGKLIKSDSLYINLCDYWTCFHASNSIVLFTWYHPKMALLEKNIRKKLKTMKDLPFDNIVLKNLEKKMNILIRKSTWGETRKFFNDGR